MIAADNRSSSVNNKLTPCLLKLAGILIGRFGLISHNNGLAERKQLMDVSTSLLAAISATNIDNNIRYTFGMNFQNFYCYLFDFSIEIH